MVTRRGKPAAVLISPDELEALEETLAVLSDPELMTRVREGEESVARGESVTLEELREKAAGAVLETLDAIAANPRPAGKPLQFALGGVDGRFAGGPTGVVYRLDEEDQS